MEYTSKQRAYLRSEAQELPAIVMVGKEGLTDSVVTALKEAVDHHELVKVKFQAFKEDVREISFSLAETADGEEISTNGFTAVFFKQKEKKEERKYNI